MVYKWITLSVFLICLNISASNAQVFNGTVVDEETGYPVPYSNIFLTNTTLGVSADQNGDFSLQIPEGNYEVVVRMLGYELMVFNLRTEEMGTSYLIKLKPDLKQLSEIKVVAKRDELWYRNLEIFKSYFLGTSNRARKCEILNPEVLVFDSESKSGILTARAGDVLKINNPELGYEIDYILTEFKLDSIGEKVLFQGYPSYKNLSKYNSKLPRRIIRNRENAYKGSLHHFLRSVYDGNADQEGYLVRQVIKAPNPDRPSDQEIAEAKERIRQTTSNSEKNSLYRNYLVKESLPKMTFQGDTIYVDTDEFITKLDNGKVQLQFEEYLEVTYLKQVEEKAYFLTHPTNPNIHKNSQVSILRLNVDSTIINNQGVTYNPFDILLLGYMGWEKMGDFVPIDY